ncbi:PAS domain S-box [Leptolyngbyaceae cyanobacterium JSC-12]|nr:PAS domain S-box [Leptolyngbyaceae cyanobacterium JSC-12]
MRIALLRSLRHFIANIPLRGVLVVLLVSQTVGVAILVSYLSYRSGQKAVENLGYLCLLMSSMAIALGWLAANWLETHALGIVRDVSDRKATELALQQSEARYQAIVESQSELICRSLPDTTILFVNDAYCRYFGQQREDLLGKSFLPFVDIEDQNNVTQLMQSLSFTHPIRTSENRVVVNGKMRWVQWVNQALFDDQGTIIEIQTIGRDITELKQTAAALQESNDRFRQFAEAVREGFFIFETATSQYSYLNPACINISGIPDDPSPADQDYVKGMTHWFKHIHPDDRDRIAQALQQEQRGKQFNEEYRFIRPDGELRWLRSQAFPIQDEHGKVVRIVGTVEDISDRKQVEIALQASEARYRAIVEDQSEFICRYQPDNTVTFANAAYCRYFGLDPQTVVGSRYEPLIFEADREQVSQLIRSVSWNNPTVTIENRVYSHGEVRWTQWQSRAIFNEQGKFIEFQAVGRDITEQRQMEEALRASEERFRRAFDDAPIGMSLVLPTGQFLRVNAHYCNLLGYTEAELLALTFQKVTHPADLEEDLKGFEELLSGKIHVFQMKKRYVTKQGVTVPVLMNTAPVRDQNGQVLYLVGHIQDIRDRLKVEQLKDEFISVVSHELRTPLTSIRGALGILETEILKDRPEKAKHMLRIALNNSERLVRLVDDILSLERLESGKVRLVMEPCQVADLMQQAVEGIQAIAEQAAIIFSVTPLSATMWASPDALVQTLTNLLSNAIKFSAPGSTVWLAAEFSSLTLPSSPRYPVPAVLFSVTDQGRGIPADKLNIIFEKFQQVDISDARKKAGTGLGLAICKNIVQQHGGQIWAESVLGKGSTFYFTVPLENGEGESSLNH